MLGDMVKKTTVVLVDDLNGKPADTSIRFGLDSREYEPDLTDKNAQELRESLDRYSPPPEGTGGRRSNTPAADKSAFTAVDPAAVRAWAKGRGIKVSQRGRVEADVLKAFRTAGY